MALPLTCQRCEKIQHLCVCSEIVPVETALHTVILQHPQEPDKELGTARIAHLALSNSTLRVGLSVRNLKAILGSEVINREWGVLYLGSNSPPRGAPTITAVNKKGAPLPDQEERLRSLQGIVLLDGTWSQAKALWWRNPWLLKLQRLVLNPPAPSLYGKLRREPRREALSTIEAAAYTLEALTGDVEIRETLLKPFRALLARVSKPAM